MTREIEGLGQETHEDLYGLADFWQKEELRVNPRSPRSGRKLVAWNQVSASQIENYVKCPRSWYFKSVARIQEPQKGHQALGTSFHLIMEKVPKGLSFPVRADTNASEEEWDKAKLMADQVLPLLPSDPQGLVKREHGITLETYENGPLFRGYIDLAIPPGIGWPSFLIPPNEAIIGDYKTLSDFRYMKTPEELASSIQMMSYAKWAISEGPGSLVGPSESLPEHVRLLHIYAKTKSPFSRSSIRDSNAIVSVPQINAAWDKTLDIVREMQSTATCQSAEDLEAKGALNGHCEAYGGCYFRDKCGLSKDSGIKNLFQIGKKPTPPTKDANMAGSPILEKILAARAAASGVTPDTKTDQASSTPAPAAAIVSAAESVSSGNSAPTGDTSQEVSTVSGSSAVAAAPIPVKGPISGLLSKIEATGHGRPKLSGSVAAQLNKETGLTVAEYPGEGFRAGTTIASVGELMKYASGIIPPDAPPRTQAVITTPGMAVADPEAEPVVTEEESNESVSEASNVAESQATTSVPVSASEVKKRGRPSKEEMQAREAAEKAAFNAKVEAEVTKRLAVGGLSSDSSDIVQVRNQLAKAESERASLDMQLTKAREDLRSANSGRSTGPEDGLTLYVDTLPVKGSGEVTDFHEWIRPATQAVEESNGVADWRLINYTAKGLLASQIRELIKLTGLPKALMIPSFAAGADIALEILSPQAKRIIRPLK